MVLRSLLNTSPRVKHMTLGRSNHLETGGVLLSGFWAGGVLPRSLRGQSIRDFVALPVLLRKARVAGKSPGGDVGLDPVHRGKNGWHVDG